MCLHQRPWPFERLRSTRTAAAAAARTAAAQAAKAAAVIRPQEERESRCIGLAAEKGG